MINCNRRDINCALHPNNGRCNQLGILGTPLCRIVCFSTFQKLGYVFGCVVLTYINFSFCKIGFEYIQHPFAWFLSNGPVARIKTTCSAKAPFNFVYNKPFLALYHLVLREVNFETEGFGQIWSIRSSKL